MPRAELTVDREAVFEQLEYTPHSAGQKAAHDSDARFRTVCCGRRWGKALNITTPILTNSGWKTMLEVQSGDVVYDELGQPCNVTAATEVMYGRPCYKFVFNDGSEIIADGLHQWLTWDKPARKAIGDSRRHTQPEIRTSEEISHTLTTNAGENNHSIQVAQPIQFATKQLLLDPYVLGVWLGDGTSNNGQITCHSDSFEILEKIEDAGFELSDVESGKYTYNVVGLKIKLGELAVLYDKHIPREYLYASVEQRSELLRGLMDTDGTCGTNGQVEFSNTNEDLSLGVFWLAVSLGMIPKLYTKFGTLNGKTYKKVFRIRFMPNRAVFNLTYKLERQMSAQGRGLNRYMRYITKCEQIDSVPVKCISVDSESHLFLAGHTLIPTHNSIWAGHEMTLKMFVPDSINWIVGPKYVLGEREFKVVWNDFTKLGILKRCKKSYNIKQGDMRIYFPEMNSLCLVVSAEKPDCYDDQTEILTDEGWKLFRDLNKNEKVLTFNVDEKTYEWQSPTRYISYDNYEDTMIRIKNRRLDLLVTPNHKFLFKSRYGEYVRKTIADLKWGDTIPFDGEWIGNDLEFLTDDECALLGFYLAEGSVYIGPKDYRVNLSQNHGYVLEEVGELLDNMNINWSYSSGGIVFSSKKYALLFKELGNRYVKYIPDAYKNLPARKLRTIIEWMMKGDGTTQDTWAEYYTTSKQLADDFQEICIKAGMAATIRQKKQGHSEIKGRKINSKAILYAISLIKTKNAHLHSSSQDYISGEEYSGSVYCVEVPNHNVMVRRNGKVAWCGNSLLGETEGLDHVIMSEAARHRMFTWQQYIEPALMDKRGSADFPSTPKGFNWFKGMFDLGTDPDYPDYESWHFPSWTNKILFPGGYEDPELVRIRNARSNQWWDQEYGAKFTAYEGLIYQDFDTQVHVKRIEFDPYWENFLTLDFGFKDPTICLDVMVNPSDQRVYVWREYCHIQRIASENALQIRNREQPPGYHIDAIYADPRGADEIATMSLVLGHIYANAMGRSLGIEAVAAALKVRDDGLPGLIIDPSCTNLLEEIQGYHAKPTIETRNEKAGTIETEGPDHSLDALRYFFNERFVLGGGEGLADIYNGYERSEADTFFNYVTNFTDADKVGWR